MTEPGPLTELLATAARTGVRGPWLFDYAVVLLAGRAAALVPLLDPADTGRPALPDGVCAVATALLDSLEGFADLRAPHGARTALCATAERFANAVGEWVFDTERRIAEQGAPSNADALRTSWNALEMRIVLTAQQCMDA